MWDSHSWLCCEVGSMVDTCAKAMHQELWCCRLDYVRAPGAAQSMLAIAVWHMHM